MLQSLLSRLFFGETAGRGARRVVDDRRRAPARRMSVEAVELRRMLDGDGFVADADLDQNAIDPGDAFFVAEEGGFIFQVASIDGENRLELDLRAAMEDARLANNVSGGVLISSDFTPAQNIFTGEFLPLDPADFTSLDGGQWFALTDAILSRAGTTSGGFSNSLDWISTADLKGASGLSLEAEGIQNYSPLVRVPSREIARISPSDLADDEEAGNVDVALVLSQPPRESMDTLVAGVPRVAPRQYVPTTALRYDPVESSPRAAVGRLQAIDVAVTAPGDAVHPASASQPVAAEGEATVQQASHAEDFETQAAIAAQNASFAVNSPAGEDRAPADELAIAESHVPSTLAESAEWDAWGPNPLAIHRAGRKVSEPSRDAVEPGEKSDASILGDEEQFKPVPLGAPVRHWDGRWELISIAVATGTLSGLCYVETPEGQSPRSLPARRQSSR